LKLLEAELLAGPPSQDSRRGWTLARIGKLIRKKFGISYHPGHVWKILRRIGWNAPQPTTPTRKRAKIKPTARA
jgi:transposase